MDNSQRPASRDAVLDAIRRHLVACEVPEDRITEDASFTADLEVDSLDLQTLAQILEDDFDVRITSEDASTLQTIGQAADFVVERTSGARSVA